ncbi:MAG: polyprenyl synthetase family protein [Armatimonadia bacterium]
MPSPVSPATHDQALSILAEPVASALVEVERRLENLIPEQIGGLVPVIYRHVLQAGGKRLRPILALLSCSAAGGDQSAAVDLAVAVEVLHLSSLIHDDVIDQATERRGRPSVRQRWGNRASILVGDFLVAEVFRRLADDLGRQSLTVLAQSVVDMCQAELTETENGPTEDEYFCNIRGKTAALMASACEIGAIAAGNDSATRSLHQYGEKLGLAFQIVDDLLDLYGDPGALGKPVLQDLREGHWTLPVIQALSEADAGQRAALLELLRAAPHDDEAARAAAELTAELGGRAYAREYAARLANEAAEALGQLAPSPAVESLRSLAAYVLTRHH